MHLLIILQCITMHINTIIQQGLVETILDLPGYSGSGTLLTETQEANNLESASEKI